MIGTYATAALICAVSLLVGRAALVLAGGTVNRWLAPAVGFGAMLTVGGFLARAPGHATSAGIGLVVLVAAAAFVLWRRPERPTGDLLRVGLPLALVLALVLSVPFAFSGRWGLLGVGFNNDLGLHLAWAEWLRNGLGPAPEAGYPLGPHALAASLAALPGIGLGQAFVGEIFAIAMITAWTALAALGDLGTVRKVLAATLVAISYLGASYFAQGAFKELAEALFVIAFALYLRALDRRWTPNGTDAPSGPPAPGLPGWVRFLLPPLALAGGIFFSYSFAGLAWPVLILVLWAAATPAVRGAFAPRALLRTLRRPVLLLAIAVALAGAAALTLVGPFAFVHGFNRVAGTNTYGPVSPVEALGIWPAANYRLSAAGGAHLTGLAGAVAVLAVALGAIWWLRRRDYAVPIGLAACTILYVASLATSGQYSQAKALMIGAPLAMLLAIRPLLSELPRRRASNGRYRHVSGPSAGWAFLAVAFVAGAAYSGLLVLRDAPVGPPGHGSELRAFMPYLEGERVLYAGQDRYAAYELLGADPHVPLVEFPDGAVAQNPEKPFDTGDAYSPIDFDSFSRGTLAYFPYVVTGHAAWNSEAPPGFERVASTPSYLLWKRTGSPPRDRHVLLEGTEPGAYAGCDSPEIRILLSNRGRASLFPPPAIGGKGAWSPDSILETGESAAQTLRLPAGRWQLSLQYFSPFGLTLRAPGLRQPLKAALDGQRPSTISLASNGQFWPAGTISSPGGRVRFTVSAADPNALQRLVGYSAKAELGELVAVPARRHRVVPLGQACDSWLDWYEAEEVP
jgi:hypothetical protein